MRPIDVAKRHLLRGLWLLAWPVLPAAHALEATPAKEHGTGHPPVAAAKLLRDWAPYVDVVTLSPSDDHAWLKVSGRLGYDEDHTQQIRSPINGRITQVFVRLGQAVKTGDRLLSFVSAEAAQLKAELTKDAEDIAVYARARERARSLQTDGAVSPREVAEAEANYNKAVAEQARDLSHVAALGLDVKTPGAEAVLIARMPGVVTAREAVVGMELRADVAQPLVVVSDLSRLWLWANVFERDLRHVQAGARVTVGVAAWPGQEFVGTLDYIGDVLDADTHTLKVRCTLDNRGRELKPQMFADVAIEQAGTTSLWLPSEAVVTRGQQTLVVCVAADDTLRLRQVHLGGIVGGQQPVQSGLTAGERIISKGALLVAEELGQLKPQPEGSQAP